MLVVVGRLAVWQAIIQLLGVVTGFALLRWLEVDDYAQFTLAFGFASTLSLIVDLGFGQAVMALVGEDVRDEALVRRYIVAARRLRNLTMIIVLPLAAPLFAALTANQGWNWDERVVLFASVAITIVGRSFQDFYGLPLILREAHTQYLRPQAAGLAVRLGASGLARSSGILTGSVAAVLSSLLTVIPSIAYRRRLGALTGDSGEEERRRLLRYALPLTPMLLYTAFQTQIGIFILSLVGSTRSVAEIGALSRLGQLFNALAVINGLLIAPRVARATRAQVVRTIFTVVAATIALGAAATAVASLFPSPFLFLLGDRYASLEDEIAPFMLVSAIGFLSGVIFTINSARAWIYWWLSGLLIGGVIGAQALSLLVIDVTSTSGVVTFMLITNATQAAVATSGLVYGLRRGSRLERGP